MVTEWYRRTSWTKSDEVEFFERLGRAREDGRAQYLKIQALTLIESEKPGLLMVAETLLNKILSDFPDNRSEKSQALNALGVVHKRRGDSDLALQYFQQAVDFEKEFPNSKSGASLNFAEAVVEIGETNLYDKVEELLSAELNSGGFMFPSELYTVASVLSVISAGKGDNERAKFYADEAVKNATARTNTLWNPRKQHLGLVKRKSWLDELVKKGLES